MEIIEQVIDVETPEGPMAVLHKQPVGDGPWPTIVIFHDAPAIRAAIHEFMAKLAGDGFRVVTPDLFHREGRMIGFEPDAVRADPSLRERMWALIASLTDAGIQSDLDATLDAIDLPDESRLGTIGFCLGARAVYRTLTRFPERFAAGAMFHPSFLANVSGVAGEVPPSATAAHLTQSLYIGIGTADEVQSIEMHRPFFDAVGPLANVEVIEFEGADHGFTWPGYATYHPEASNTSYVKTLELFRSHLVAG